MAYRGEKLSLGIDLGTSSCKFCAVDPRGRIVGVASSGYPTFSPFSGWAEQNPRDWIEAAASAAAALWESGSVDPRSVERITLTSAAHIAAPTDADGVPVRHALLWSDQRSKAEAESLRRAYGEYIMARGYNNVSTSWSLPHLVWVREREPEVWGKVRMIFLSKDYLLFKLTGERVTDPATAVSAMLYDGPSMQWSEKLCSLADIDVRALPAVRPPQEVAGHLTKEGRRILRLEEGIPVFNGTLDSATETFGAGAVAPGDLVIRIGTAGGIHIIKETPSPNPRLLTYPFPLNGLWYSQAGTSSAGSAIAWAVTSEGGAKSPDGFRSFGQKAARAPAGSLGLLFHPFLSGERTPYWEPGLRGTFTGASFQHTDAHFARAVLEGVAFSLCDAFAAIMENQPIPDQVRVVGGGTREPVLLEILSATLGVRLQAMPQVDSAYGAALLGLHADGSLRTRGGEPDGGAASTVFPDQALSDTYKKMFEKYRIVAGHLLSLYRDISSIDDGHIRGAKVGEV